MRTIRVDVTETASYQRTYRVPDDFNIDDVGALEDLYVNDDDAVTKGFRGVEERNMSAVIVGDTSPVDVDWTGREDYQPA